MQTHEYRVFWWSLALALNACAQEAVIGQERCVGADTHCAPGGKQGFGVPPAPIDVDTFTEHPLRVGFVVEKWCAECDSDPAGPPQLIADALDGVWALGYASPLSGVYYAHVGDKGQVDLSGMIPEPEAYPEYKQVFLAQAQPAPEGGFVLGLTWSRLSGPVGPVSFVQEVVRVTPEKVARFVVKTLPPPMNTPLVSFDAVPAGADDSVLFLFSYGEKTVRKVDSQGQVIWQQTELPAWANAPDAILRVGQSFVLAAHEFYSGLSKGSQGLVWFDANGNIQLSDVLPSIADPVPLSGDRVALVYPSYESDSDTDVIHVDLAVQRFGVDHTSVGHRLLSQGFTGIALKAFTSDAADNVYASLLAGTRDAPRTTLCMLPEGADGVCYLAPEGLFPTTLAATSEGVVYALTKNKITRLEFP